MGSALKLREFGDLVGLAYEGIDEAQPWMSLVRELSERTEAHDASLVISSPVTSGTWYLVTDNPNPSVTQPDYVSGVMAVNDFMGMPQPEPSSIDELMPGGAFLETPLYRRFLQPLNIRYLLGNDIVRTDTVWAKLVVERTAEQGPFTGREKELLGLVTPHLQRALRLRETQSSGSYMQRFFEEAMSRLSIACLLLNGTGRVVSMNGCASSLLERSELLSIRGGQLRCHGVLESRELQRAIDLALAAHHNRCRVQRGSGLRLNTRPDHGAFDVVIKPLIGDEVLVSRDQPAAVVYINECGSQGALLDTQVLGAMFGFTPCESRLAALLAGGSTLDDAAAQLGVSINTVKTHLRGVYEKMGVNKQSQVVARLNHSAARLL